MVRLGRSAKWNMYLMILVNALTGKQKKGTYEKHKTTIDRVLEVRNIWEEFKDKGGSITPNSGQLSGRSCRETFPYVSGK